MLLMTVFVTGAIVLVIEVSAFRILSPFFGNTIFSFSSVITIILFALALGYFWGGKRADKYPFFGHFYVIIMWAGIAVLFSYLLTIFLLPTLGTVLPFTTGPLITAFVLFFVPAFLLGTLSPYAVRLAYDEQKESGLGAVSGLVFFWSTTGSITGSLVTGFFLIPHLGLSYITLGVAILLLLIGAGGALHVKEKILTSKKIILIVLLLVIVFFSFSLKASESIIYSTDGTYEKITVEEKTQNTIISRTLFQDRSSSGGIVLGSGESIFSYTNFNRISDLFVKNPQNTLVLGSGAYVIPRDILARHPVARVDVVDIEPKLLGIARGYFELKDYPTLNTITDDARRFLRNSSGNYDVIFGDAYSSLYSVPYHLITREFFALAKEKLSKDGVFLVNIIGDLSSEGERSLLLAAMKTFRSVFPVSSFFAVESPESSDVQNIIFLGLASDVPVTMKEVFEKNTNPSLSYFKDKLIPSDQILFDEGILLTDDYAPVEYLTAPLFKKNTRDKKDSFARISGTSVLAHVQSQLDFGPRFLSAPGRIALQDFLIKFSNKYSSSVTVQEWPYVTKEKETYVMKNIVVRLFPEKIKRIILGTHYDTVRYLGMDIRNGEHVIPGANNGASGVAVLMSLLEYFSNNKLVPNVGIDFVFFDGEEGEEGVPITPWSPIGSSYFADNISSLYKKELPQLAFVVDMVCDKDLSFYQEKNSMASAPKETGDFWKFAHNLSPKTFVNTEKYAILDDHTALQEVGIPSVLIIDFDYPFIYTQEDSFDKCSPKSLELVSNVLRAYIESL